MDFFRLFGIFHFIFLLLFYSAQFVGIASHFNFPCVCLPVYFFHSLSVFVYDVDIKLCAVLYLHAKTEQISFPFYHFVWLFVLYILLFNFCLTSRQLCLRPLQSVHRTKENVGRSKQVQNN